MSFIFYVLITRYVKDKYRCHQRCSNITVDCRSTILKHTIEAFYFFLYFSSPKAVVQIIPCDK